MSTKSLLYHAFRLGPVELLKTDYKEGATYFHIRTPRERLACANCASRKVAPRGTVVRRFRCLPIGSRPSFIVAHIKRLSCCNCSVLRQEKLSFAAPHKRYTRAFARYVLELSSITTIQDLARQLRVSWDLIRQIQEADLRRQVAKIKLNKLRRLAVDELAVGKGHKYVSIVMDLDSGAVVHVGEGKGANAVSDFFQQLKRCGADIEAVACDMSGAWPKAVKQAFPKAHIVFDHFHIAKLMNDKLSQLRRQVQNEANALGKAAVKGSRWILLKNPKNLCEEKGEVERLEQALKLNRPLATAYYLKEELRQLYRQKDAASAEALLADWCKRAEASNIPVLQTMAKTLRRCQEGILNYYTHPISTGPLEGFNNKAQTMKRQAYGYRNMDFYKLKLMTLHKKKYALTG